MTPSRLIRLTSSRRLLDRRLRALVVHAEVDEGRGARDLRGAPRLLQPDGGDLRPTELVRPAPPIGRHGVVHLDPALHQRRERAGAGALEVVRVSPDGQNDIAAARHYLLLSVVRSSP